MGESLSQVPVNPSLGERRPKPGYRVFRIPPVIGLLVASAFAEPNRLFLRSHHLAEPPLGFRRFECSP
jgi:hypothetical protein